MDFFYFFPITVIVYYICPKSFRYLWLLAASYYFYMQWNPVYGLLLFFCTFVTYIMGRVLEYLKNRKSLLTKKYQKFILIGGLICLLGVLGFFKYFNFGLACVNHFLLFIGKAPFSWKTSVLLPVGISFFTLQALGYLIDVYRDDIYAEKNFFRYALFISFFPQLVAGPIERSKNLLKQLNEPQPLVYENIRKGLLLIAYGLFCKMVIADRAAILVDTVYGAPQTYGGLYIVVATFFFTFQIYCDFYGYSTIARGCALTMGIHLMDNFNAPYFSKSIKEFWRRWHISLSEWLRDYLYIPLGGNRRGGVCKERNVLITFAVSGLWHGASFAYIVWGILHGAYQVAEDIGQAMKQNIQSLYNKICFSLKDEEADKTEMKPLLFSTQVWRTIRTFILVSFAWLFFRSGGLTYALVMLRELKVINWQIIFDGSLYTLGVSREEIYMLLLAIVVLMYVDYKKYRGIDVADLLLAQGWWLRTLIIITLVLSILLFGCYGEIYDTKQFIYFQF